MERLQKLGGCMEAAAATMLEGEIHAAIIPPGPVESLAEIYRDGTTMLDIAGRTVIVATVIVAYVGNAIGGTGESDIGPQRACASRAAVRVANQRPCGRIKGSTCAFPNA
jgi:hypothetical protein